MNKYESVGRGGRGRFLIILGRKIKKIDNKRQVFIYFRTRLFIHFPSKNHFFSQLSE